MQLDSIGFDHYKKQIKDKLDISSTDSVARIFSEHKTGWDMITDEGPLEGIIMTTLRQNSINSQLPKAGDWVTYEKVPNENKAKITRVLPRYSFLSRHMAKTDSEQIIATNIDVMFMVISVDQLFNPMQLNRYLTIANTGNVRPIVVINKTDKQEDTQNIISEIATAHPDLQIISTSAKTKTGLKQLESSIPPGLTAVLVGNSGTGKSSLVNALLDNANQSTKHVGILGKGRHTTTRRELFVLNNGGIIIDTPGMRTLEIMPTEQSGHDSIFTELEQLRRQCKFRNCDHIKSKGCAIQKALAENIITQKQFDQFMSLTKTHKPKPSYNKSRN